MANNSVSTWSLDIMLLLICIEYRSTKPWNQRSSLQSSLSNYTSTFPTTRRTRLNTYPRCCRATIIFSDCCSGSPASTRSQLSFTIVDIALWGRHFPTYLCWHDRWAYTRALQRSKFGTWTRPTTCSCSTTCRPSSHHRSPRHTRSHYFTSWTHNSPCHHH